MYSAVVAETSDRKWVCGLILSFSFAKLSTASFNSPAYSSLMNINQHFPFTSGQMHSLVDVFLCRLCEVRLLQGTLFYENFLQHPILALRILI